MEKDLYSTRHLVALAEIRHDRQVLQPGAPFTATPVDAGYLVSRMKARETFPATSAPAAPAAGHSEVKTALDSDADAPPVSLSAVVSSVTDTKKDPSEETLSEPTGDGPKAEETAAPSSQEQVTDAQASGDKEEKAVQAVASRPRLAPRLSAAAKKTTPAADSAEGKE